MKRVIAYFDYASPFSYLAHGMLARAPGLAVEWRPIYLRGLETFANGVPYGAAKMAYLARDLARCAEHEGVPLSPPVTFPLDGLHALRASLVARERGAFDAYHAAAFRAAWAEQRDIGSKEIVAGLLAEAIGEPAGPELVASFSSDAIKQKLRAETAAAAARGVFGVPAFLVGDELFWGHDRLDYVRRAATT